MLNLPHCTVNRKNNGKIRKNKNWKISEVTITVSKPRVSQLLVNVQNLHILCTSVDRFVCFVKVWLFDVALHVSVQHSHLSMVRVLLKQSSINAEAVNLRSVHILLYSRLDCTQQSTSTSHVLTDRSQIVYTLRNRNHNKILIAKTSDLNERHFLIRVLYKHCYWL